MSGCSVAIMGVTAGSLLKWSETTSRRNEEQSRTATEIFPSDMIYTIVEGLFQQLLTAFAVGTGKRHWSTTSEKDQTSCHNSTTASKLASRLNFSRDVIATGETIAASLTPMKYQIY